jgi:hypothetical protein
MACCESGSTGAASAIEQPTQGSCKCELAPIEGKVHHDFAKDAPAPLQLAIGLHPHEFNLHFTPIFVSVEMPKGQARIRAPDLVGHQLRAPPSR